MTLWGYQVDLDVFVYSNVYVALSIHVKRKRKKSNCVWRGKNHNEDRFISIIK